MQNLPYWVSELLLWETNFYVLAETPEGLKTIQNDRCFKTLVAPRSNKTKTEFMVRYDLAAFDGVD